MKSSSRIIKSKEIEFRSSKSIYLASNRKLCLCPVHTFWEHRIAVTALFSVFWIHWRVVAHLVESLFYLFKSQKKRSALMGLLQWGLSSASSRQKLYNLCHYPCFLLICSYLFCVCYLIQDPLKSIWNCRGR